MDLYRNLENVLASAGISNSELAIIMGVSTGIVMRLMIQHPQMLIDAVNEYTSNV